MTQSSTEAKLVGVNDAMTLVMWAKYFFDYARCLYKQSLNYDFDNDFSK